MDCLDEVYDLVRTLLVCSSKSRGDTHFSRVAGFWSSLVINRFEYSTANPRRDISKFIAFTTCRLSDLHGLNPRPPLGRRSDGVSGGSSIDVPWRYSPMQEAENFNAADLHEIVWTCLNLMDFVKFCQCICFTRKQSFCMEQGQIRSRRWWIFRVVWNAFLPVSQCARAPVSHERFPFLRGRL